MWEGRLLTEPGEIKEAAKLHFQGIFKKRRFGSIFSVKNCIRGKLDLQDAEFLERAISMEEVDLAISQCNSDKTPGPDEINAGALKFLWKHLQKEMMEFIGIFMKEGVLPAGMNSSFITLVPKVKNPTVFADFRPISLINCSLKVLSKLLASRLAVVLDKLISKHQIGFIKGRKISEGILITNEVVHSLSKGDVGGVVLKLDFEKAFDSVD